jgi:phosphoserine phosphatase
MDVRWRPYPVTLFDCDSTLSAVEGIDELADDPGHQAEIAALTERAMDGQLPLEEVYGRRLSLVNPTREEIRSVKASYKANAVPDAQATIAALDEAGNETWVISGGLLDPVAEFATWLGIASDRVRAVGTHFDPLHGDWWNQQTQPRYADHDRSELTTTTGKADVIRANVTSVGRRLLIGDGVSDLAASCEVDLFVAYAGVVSRPAVVDQARVVVTSASIAPVLALALGPARVRELIGGPHDAVARSCLDAIDAGAVRFNDEELGRRFASSTG